MFAKSFPPTLILIALTLFFNKQSCAQELKVLKSDITSVKGLGGYEYIGNKDGDHYIYNWQNILVLDKDFKFKKEITELAKLWQVEMRLFGGNIACIAGEKEIMAYDTNGEIAWGEKLKPYKSSGQSGNVTTNPGTHYIIEKDKLYVSSYTGSNLVSINFGGKDVTAHYVLNCFNTSGELLWVVPFEKSEEVISNFVLATNNKYIYALTEKSSLGSKSFIKIDTESGEIVDSKIINSDKTEIIYNARLINDPISNNILVVAFKGEKETVKDLQLTGFITYSINQDDLSIEVQDDLSFESANILDDFQNTKFVRGDPKNALLSKSGYPRNLEFVDMEVNEKGEIVALFEQNYNGCYGYTTNNSMMASPSNPTGSSTTYACEAFHKNLLLVKLNNGKIDPNVHFVHRSTSSSGSFDSFGEPLMFKQDGKIHVLYFHTDAITPTKNTMEMKIFSIGEDLSGDIKEKLLLKGFNTYFYELADSFFDEETKQVILLGAEKRKSLVIGTVRF